MKRAKKKPRFSEKKFRESLKGVRRETLILLLIDLAKDAIKRDANGSR